MGHPVIDEYTATATHTTAVHIKAWQDCLLLEASKNGSQRRTMSSSTTFCSESITSSASSSSWLVSPSFLSKTTLTARLSSAALARTISRQSTAGSTEQGPSSLKISPSLNAQSSRITLTRMSNSPTTSGFPIYC